MKLSALDHTLGHSAEPRDLIFTADDRVAIARRLDQLGIDLIEGGAPATDCRAREFFERMRQDGNLKHARLVASVRIDAIREALGRDTGIQAVVDGLTPVIALEACGWHAGPVGLHEYCRRIIETVRYFKAKGRTVIFRAEDFFQGYVTDPAFALRMLESAKVGGAEVLCLADSAEGALPHTVREVCLEVRKRFDGVLGIRAHDSHALAAANTLEAVEQGFTHVEGSVEASRRSESANLCSIIATLEYKLGHTVIGSENLAELPAAGRYVAEAGAAPTRPPVAPDAEAVLHSADSRLRRRLRARERHAVLDRIRLMDSLGYDLRTADGTLELILREALAPDRRPFEAERYDVISHSALFSTAMTTATATVRVGDAIRTESEEGSGPVDALERSLRQCLFAVYPAIAQVHVRDCRIERTGDPQDAGTRTRVALIWTEAGKCWTTAGVSEDLIEAAWLALTDGFRLELLRLGEHGERTIPVAGDSSWAV